MHRVIKVFMRTLVCKANLDTFTDGVNQTVHTLPYFSWFSMLFATCHSLSTQSAQISYYRYTLCILVNILKKKLCDHPELTSKYVSNQITSFEKLIFVLVVESITTFDVAPPML